MHNQPQPPRTALPAGISPVPGYSLIVCDRLDELQDAFQGFEALEQLIGNWRDCTDARRQESLGIAPQQLAALMQALIQSTSVCLAAARQAAEQAASCAQAQARERAHA